MFPKDRASPHTEGETTGGRKGPHRVSDLPRPQRGTGKIPKGNFTVPKAVGLAHSAPGSPPLRRTPLPVPSRVKPPARQVCGPPPGAIRPPSPPLCPSPRCARRHGSANRPHAPAAPRCSRLPSPRPAASAPPRDAHPQLLKIRHFIPPAGASAVTVPPPAAANDTAAVSCNILHWAPL